MPLNKTALKNEIKQIMTDMREREDVSDDEFANRLSTAIDDYVKTATIMYTTGLVAPTGPVTGVFTGNLQ